MRHGRGPGALVERQHDRERARGEDAEQADEDEVVRGVGERALVAALADVQRDVPEHPEQRGEQRDRQDRGGQRDPARAADRATQPVAEPGQHVRAPGAVGAPRPISAAVTTPTPTRRAEHLLDRGAAGRRRGGTRRAAARRCHMALWNIGDVTSSRVRCTTARETAPIGHRCQLHRRRLSCALTWPLLRNPACSREPAAGSHRCARHGGRDGTARRWSRASTRCEFVAERLGGDADVRVEGLASGRRRAARPGADAPPGRGDLAAPTSCCGCAASSRRWTPRPGRRRDGRALDVTALVALRVDSEQAAGGGGLDPHLVARPRPAAGASPAAVAPGAGRPAGAPRRGSPPAGSSWTPTSPPSTATCGPGSRPAPAATSSPATRRSATSPRAYGLRRGRHHRRSMPDAEPTPGRLAEVADARPASTA